MKFNILILSVALFSCGPQKKEPANVQLNDSQDTLQVIKRYPSGKVREVITYQSNKPDKNTGFSEGGDTIRFPKLVLVEPGDSLFAFVPLNKYVFGNLLFSLDSLDAMRGTPPKMSVDANKSCMLKIQPDMFTEPDKISGTFRLANPDGTFDYWPFVVKTK